MGWKHVKCLTISFITNMVTSGWSKHWVRQCHHLTSLYTLHSSIPCEYIQRTCGETLVLTNKWSKGFVPARVNQVSSQSNQCSEYTAHIPLCLSGQRTCHSLASDSGKGEGSFDILFRILQLDWSAISIGRMEINLLIFQWRCFKLQFDTCKFSNLKPHFFRFSWVWNLQASTVSSTPLNWKHTRFIN